MNPQTEALIANNIGPKATYVSSGVTGAMGLVDQLNATVLVVGAIVTVLTFLTTIYYKHKASKRDAAEKRKRAELTDTVRELRLRADQRAEELHQARLQALAGGASDFARVDFADTSIEETVDELTDELASRPTPLEPEK